MSKPYANEIQGIRDARRILRESTWRRGQPLIAETWALLRLRDRMARIPMHLTERPNEAPVLEQLARVQLALEETRDVSPWLTAEVSGLAEAIGTETPSYTECVTQARAQLQTIATQLAGSAAELQREHLATIRRKAAAQTGEVLAPLALAERKERIARAVRSLRRFFTSLPQMANGLAKGAGDAALRLARVDGLLRAGERTRLLLPRLVGAIEFEGTRAELVVLAEQRLALVRRIRDALAAAPSRRHAEPLDEANGGDPTNASGSGFLLKPPPQPEEERLKALVREYGQLNLSLGETLQVDAAQPGAIERSGPMLVKGPTAPEATRFPPHPLPTPDEIDEALQPPGPISLRTRLDDLETDVRRVSDEARDRALAALADEVRKMIDDTTRATEWLDSTRALRDLVGKQSGPQLTALTSEIRKRSTFDPPLISPSELKAAEAIGIGAEITFTFLTFPEVIELGQLLAAAIDLHLQIVTGAGIMEWVLAGLEGRPPETSEVAPLTALLDGVEIVFGEPTAGLSQVRDLLAQLRQTPLARGTGARVLEAWGTGPAAQGAVLAGIRRPSELEVVLSTLKEGQGIAAGLGAGWQAAVEDRGATLVWGKVASPIRIELHAGHNGETGWAKLSRGPHALDVEGHVVEHGASAARIPTTKLTDELVRSLLRRLDDASLHTERP